MAADLELTPTLIEFGCDEALWRSVRNKQALLDMADSNEAQCRKRIEFLKQVVANGDGAASGAPRPQRDQFQPFELFGEAPEGVEASAVEALLEERIEYKKVRDFDGADRIQAELLAMGVYVNDRQRTWSKAKNPSGGFSLKGPAPEGVDVAAVEALLDKRRDAKKAREFTAADEIQAELLAMGVFVNDKERVWMARKGPRETRPFTLRGPVPEGVEVAAVEALLEKRTECKKARDWEASDQIQADLLKMGVYVNDKERTWEEAGWVQRNKTKEAAAEAPAEP